MKILVLGSDGFVGRNLLEDLSAHFDCFGSTRRSEKLSSEAKLIHFDLEDDSTWKNLIELHPDCIINCIVSGAVKKLEDIKRAIDTNYLHTTTLFDFVASHLPQVYLVHLGTAFEYSHHTSALTEETGCRPRNYYGISKLLTSHYLLNNAAFKNFTIVRPFNLFGPYDKEEKIIPHLICAQRDKKTVALTEGLQERDYFFVKDLSTIIEYLIRNKNQRIKVINAGSGRPVVLKHAAEIIAKYLPDYDPALWKWGKLPYRDGEGKKFYNASKQLTEKDVHLTPFEEAIKATVAYYCGVKQLNRVW